MCSSSQVALNRLVTVRGWRLVDMYLLSGRDPLREIELLCYAGDLVT